MSDTITISIEAIKKIAEEHPGAKEALEKLLPEPFEFEEGMNLSSNPSLSVPCLFIGKGAAPDGLENRCLVVASAYRMETQENAGYTILTFYKKWP